MIRKALVGLLAAMLSSQVVLAERYDPLFTPAPVARIAQQGLLVGLDDFNGETIVVGAMGTMLARGRDHVWTQLNVPTSVLLTAVHRVDAEHIWAVGHEGVILQSTDGGVSWVFRMDGYRLLEKEYTWLQEREAYLEEAIENSEDEFEREDYAFALDELGFLMGGAEIQFEVGPTKPFFDVHFFNRDVGLVIGAYGSILRTQDGGATWEVMNQAIDNVVGYHPNKLAVSSDGTLILVGESGLLARSSDQGESFEMLESPYHGSLFGAVFDSQGQLWVFGLRGHVFVSSDQGDTFTQIETGTRYNINNGTLLADGRIVLVGHSGVILEIDPETYAVISHLHPSNAPLAAVLPEDNDSLLLIGRSGVQTFQLPSRQKQ